MAEDSSIRGVGVSEDSLDRTGHLRRLEPLLRSFVETVETYCEQTGEPPYWFNERATVSPLSAAAWRIGWVAIEEYVTRKVLALRSHADAPTDRHGRCDLFIRSPEGTKFAFEAKQVVGTQEQLADRLVVSLRAAREDASMLFATEAHARVALAFAVPIFPVHEWESESDPADKIHRLVGAAKEPSDQDERALLGGPRRSTFAYTFPGGMRNTRGPAGKFVWPGVILIAQLRQRAATSRVEAEVPGSV